MASRKTVRLTVNYKFDCGLLASFVCCTLFPFSLPLLSCQVCNEVRQRDPKCDKSTHPVYILVVSAIGMFLLLL